VKTSSQTAPGAAAQDAIDSRSPTSPALSSTSTVDNDDDIAHSSPEVPSLPAPKLSDRVLELLRTPPSANESARRYNNPITWDSPYPAHLRQESSSSEPSEDSPIHHLEIQTPFLRPVPSQLPASSSLVSAAVLANRARRPARGITEGWIRQHAVGDDEGTEKRLWLSDDESHPAGDSENSSLSGSFSGDDEPVGWLGPDEPDHHRTPKAAKTKSRQRSRRHSSIETLKQQNLVELDDIAAAMEIIDDLGPMPVAADGANGDGPTASSPASPIAPPLPPRTSTPPPKSPEVSKKADDVPMNGSADRTPHTPKASISNISSTTPKNNPVTPVRTPGKRLVPASTPRLRKKVPWKGKNIMIHLPRDDQRGQPGQPPMPLSTREVSRMLRSWGDLGYDIQGFDLDPPPGFSLPTEHSQSRGAWPDFDELAAERSLRKYRVQLPDLNSMI
jgi:hypothetical protein